MTHAPSSSPPPMRRAERTLFALAWCLLARWTPRPLHPWRALVLRAFGAKIGRRTHIYAGAKIWLPRNLECADDACIADGAEIYSVAPIRIGARAVISQNAFLCAASHDFRNPAFPLTAAQINVGPRAWVAARAIVLPGVALGEGCVIGAGSVVTKDMPPWAVCAGNPCRVLRRNYHEDPR